MSDQAVADRLLTVIARGITAHVGFVTETGGRPYATTAARLRGVVDAASALAEDLESHADGGR